MYLLAPFTNHINISDSNTELQKILSRLSLAERSCRAIQQKYGVKEGKLFIAFI